MSIERELRGNWDNVYYPAPEPMVEEAMAPGQQPGDVLVAEAGGGGAAFGVYPGMGKRSQKSNIGEKMIIGAPDFAAGTARGIATSAGGFGGDLQKIGRFAYALAADNQGGSFQEKLQRAAITMEDPTFFPSSEDLSKTGYTIPGTNFTIPPFAPAVPPGTTAFGMTAEERQQAAELGQNVGELAGDPVMLVKGGQMAVKGAMAAGKALAPTAAEMAVKTMDKLGTPVMMNAVPPGPSAAGAATKAMAPASDIGFYSAVEKAALNVQRNSGSGQAFLNDITKGENVKLDEIKWMGLDDFLKGKKNVTKQEVQDFVQSNRVDVQEVELSEKTVATKNQAKKSMDDQLGILNVLLPKGLSQLDQANLTTSWAAEAARGDATAAQKIQNLNLDENTMLAVKSYGDTVNQYREAFDTFMRAKKPKFNQYQLPGGENYREILLTLPSNKNQFPDFEQWITNRYGGSEVPEGVRQAARKEYEKQSSGLGISSGFQSSHFNEPNILAHMRVNDRVDADGKKMLLIEEVQSDWHQAGRERGYAKAYKKEDVKPYTSEQAKSEFGLDNADLFWYFDVPDNKLQIPKSRFATQDEALNYVLTEKKTGGDVPDAPFKDTWYQLALKRALRYAADNGYDRVGLTTGKQQAERYDLSKQVDNLLYSKNADGTYRVSAQVQGRGQMIGEAIPESKLFDYVGKEVAEKMSKGTGKQTEVAGEYDPASMTSNKKYMTELSGIDLKVGGEGMKKYYDDIYPKFLQKYGKKWNAEVGETSLSGTGGNFDYYKDGDMFSVTDGKGNQVKKFSTSQEAVKEVDRLNSLGSEPVRYIDITPEMRKSVKKGQPLAAVSSESTVA